VLLPGNVADLINFQPQQEPAQRDLCAVRHGYNNVCQKTDQLNAKEGKPNRHERIGLHMGHMDQGLTDAGNQDDRAQVVHGGASDANGRHHQHEGAEHW
jgi:hypothetical protein